MENLLITYISLYFRYFPFFRPTPSAPLWSILNVCSSLRMTATPKCFFPLVHRHQAIIRHINYLTVYIYSWILSYSELYEPWNIPCSFRPLGRSRGIGKIILKWILKKIYMWRCGLESFGSGFGQLIKQPYLLFNEDSIRWSYVHKNRDNSTSEGNTGIICSVRVNIFVGCM
jgi:uncharacterized membrane protein (DUF485 family)